MCDDRRTTDTDRKTVLADSGRRLADALRGGGADQVTVVLPGDEPLEFRVFVCRGRRGGGRLPPPPRVGERGPDTVQNHHPTRPRHHRRVRAPHPGGVPPSGQRPGQGRAPGRRAARVPRLRVPGRRGGVRLPPAPRVGEGGPEPSERHVPVVRRCLEAGDPAVRTSRPGGRPPAGGDPPTPARRNRPTGRLRRVPLQRRCVSSDPGGCGRRSPRGCGLCGPRTLASPVRVSGRSTGRSTRYVPDVDAHGQRYSAALTRTRRGNVRVEQVRYHPVERARVRRPARELAVAKFLAPLVRIRAGTRLHRTPAGGPAVRRRLVADLQPGHHPVREHPDPAAPGRAVPDARSRPRDVEPDDANSTPAAATAEAARRPHVLFSCSARIVSALVPAAGPVSRAGRRPAAVPVHAPRKADRLPWTGRRSSRR